MRVSAEEAWVQANQAHAQISNVLGDFPGVITGVIFAAIVFAVIVGGLKSIAKVTEKVVPFMGVMYVITAIMEMGPFSRQMPNGSFQIFRALL